MNIKMHRALIGFFMVALAAVTVLDLGDIVVGNAVGANKVDITDLQTIIAHVLNPVKSLPTSQTTPANILDFQRAVAKAQHPGNTETTPPIKRASKICFFRYQIIPMLEPVELKNLAETLALLPIPEVQKDTTRHLDSFVPPTDERYLFRLTPHAPPLSV